MSILRKVLISSAFAATILCGSAASPAAAANYSYGGVKFFGPAYTFQSHSGQSGNVVFFGAPPSTMPGHNGQVGNVTYLGGVHPYTYPGHTGQVGNVTYLGANVPHTVPVHTIPTPHIIRIH